MYPPPVGSVNDKRPVLRWEDYKWSPEPGVRTAASIIIEEFWWRFKCDPSIQEKAAGVLEENFTRKVKQMLHEEKAAAIKRLKKKGKLPKELTEMNEEGNSWPTKETLISAKRPDFGTDVGWRLLCEHWSSAEFRNLSLTNKRNRLANGDTVLHCSGARNVVSTRQFLKLKTGTDPGISGAWLHTHNLHRGTDKEKICSQRTVDRWENFDKAMTKAHGENWEEEHPELDGQIIYEAAGRMPHVRSAREDRLERENKQLRRDNKRFRCIELVVKSLAEKGGVDFDGIMQSASTDLFTSDSEGGSEKGRGDVGQHKTEKGMGSRTGGSPSQGNDDEENDDEEDYYGNEGYDNYGEGDEGYDNYDDGRHDDYGDELYDNYGNDGDDWT